MRSTDRIMQQHVPYYSSMKRAGAFQKTKKQQKKKNNRLTEISQSGKAVLKGKTTVNAAIMKLYKYEETGLTPHEVENLIERERNLTERLKKLEDWENE